MRIARLFCLLLCSLAVSQPTFSQTAPQPANSGGPANTSSRVLRCQQFHDADRAALVENYKAAAEEAAKTDPPDPCLPQYLRFTPPEEAVQLLRPVIAKAEAAWGADSVDILPFLDTLATELGGPRQPNDEAGALYQRILAISESAYGADNGMIALPLENLAAEYIDKASTEYNRCMASGSASQCASVRQRGYDEAEPLLLRAVKVAQDNPVISIQSIRQVEGGDRYTLIESPGQKGHDPLASAKASEYPLTRLAQFYVSAGNVPQAQDTYKQLADLDAKLYGPASQQVESTWLNLGSAYERQGNYTQAEAYYQLALGVAKQLLPPPNYSGTSYIPPVASVLQHLAEVSLEQRKIDDGKSYLQQALDTLTSSGLKPDDPALLSRMGGIAHDYASSGLYGDAQALLLRIISVEESEQSNPNMASMYATTLRQYADLLRQTNHPEAAAKVDAQVKALMENSTPKTDAPTK